MNMILGLIVFLIPSLGMLSGLSLAPTVGGFWALLFILPFIPSWNGTGHKVLTKPIIELNGYSRAMKALGAAFLIWCLICCFWSPSILKSLKTLSLVTVFIAMGFAVSPVTKNLHKIILVSFLSGFAVAIVLFGIEYHTYGILSTTFRSFFQPDRTDFLLSMLDRGCSFFSLSAWVVIGYLLQHNKKVAAITIFCLSLALLFISDSLAGFVGFVLGGITFAMLWLSKKTAVIIATSIILYFGAMPIISAQMDPMKISQETDWLPFSAKHRLFIWNFTAKKAQLHDAFGYGFDSSRYIATDTDFVRYLDTDLNLLPLHPHNSVLQVKIETGWVGLTLYALLAASVFMTIVQNSRSFSSAACFINYLFIGMVSFGIWQLWWVASGLFIFSMIKILVHPKPSAVE